MKKYDKQFKEEAVNLSQKIGTQWTSEQLGYTIAVQLSADQGMSEKELASKREIDELRRANEIFKDASGFFAKDRKK